MQLSSTSAPQIQKRRGRRAGVYNNPENRHKALATAIRVLLGASVLRYVPHYGGRHIPVDRCKGIRVSNFRSERTRSEAVGRALRTVRAFFIDVDQYGRMVPLAKTENGSEMNIIDSNPRGGNEGESTGTTIDSIIAKVLHPEAFGYTVDLTVRDGELNDQEANVNAVPTDAQDQTQFQDRVSVRFQPEAEARSRIQTEARNETQTQPQSPLPSRTQSETQTQTQPQMQAQSKVETKAQAGVQLETPQQAQAQNHIQNRSQAQPQTRRSDQSQGQQLRESEPQSQEMQVRRQEQAQVRAPADEQGQSDEKQGQQKGAQVEDKQPIVDRRGGRQVPRNNQRGHVGKRDLENELRAQHAQHAQSLLQAQQTQEQAQAQMRIGVGVAEPEAEEQEGRLARVEEDQRQQAEQQLYQSPHYDPRNDHTEDGNQNIHVPPMHVPSLEQMFNHQQQQPLQHQFLQQQQPTQAQQYQLNVLNNNSNQQQGYHMPIVPLNHSHSHIPGLGVEAHDQLSVHGYDHAHALHPTQLQLPGHGPGHGHYALESSLLAERAEIRSALVSATLYASSGVGEREEKKKSVGMILRGKSPLPFKSEANKFLTMSSVKTSTPFVAHADVNAINIAQRLDECRHRNMNSMCIMHC